MISDFVEVYGVLLAFGIVKDAGGTDYRPVANRRSGSLHLNI